MNSMSRGRFFKFSSEPISILFGHVEDGEGEDDGVVVGMHAGNDINAPREPFFEEMPTDIFRLFPRFTRDVDEDHG